MRASDFIANVARASDGEVVIYSSSIKKVDLNSGAVEFEMGRDVRLDLLNKPQLVRITVDLFDGDGVKIFARCELTGDLDEVSLTELKRGSSWSVEGKLSLCDIEYNWIHNP